MKRVNLALVLIILGLVFQFLWEALLWSTIWTHPMTSRPTDFSSFYTAGRLANADLYDHLYDVQSELQVQEQLIGRSMRVDEMLPYYHPPILVPILQVLCTKDYLASYWWWVLVMICVLVGTLIISDRLLQQVIPGVGSRILFFLSSVSFFPIFTSLLKGQDTAFLLLGGVLWLYGLVHKQYKIAGLGLALTVIRPQIAIILAVPFIFNQRKIWWWFCLGATCLALYSLALVGFNGVGDFFKLLVISGKGQGYGIIQDVMFNFSGILLRVFPHLSLTFIPALAWGLFMAVIVGLSILWKISPQIEIWHIVLAISLSLFVAPHLYYHDLSFLYVSILAVVLNMGSDKKKSRAVFPVILLVSISLIFLFSYFWDPLILPFGYLLMAVLPILAWRMKVAQSVLDQ
jgi:hypothetical protein